MVSLVPLNLVDTPAMCIVDIAGQEHDVMVVERETGFVAKSTLVDEPGRSPVSAREAIRQLILAIDHNHPKQFAYMEPEKQARLLAWIRLHLHKGSKGNTKRWNSSQLAQVVGQAVGFSVGNGELKGAMQAAGLPRAQDCMEYNTRWEFVLERSPRLRSFVWRLVSSRIGSASIDHNLSHYDTLRSRLFSSFSKFLTSLNGDSEEIPPALESYVLSQDNLLSKPFNNLAGIAESSNIKPAR